MKYDRSQVGLAYANNSFQTILDIAGRPFGAVGHAEWGMSDNSQGVQWNIEVDLDTEEARLGVNLEGMKYKGWPIATFTENEMKHSRLLEIAPHVKMNGDVWVLFYRDAWQIQSRPPIQERLISKMRLSELSEHAWQKTLHEAYACLNPTKNHRGRATQTVTRMQRGRIAMEVSPHLHIYTIVWNTTPQSESDARSRIEQAFPILKPIYEVVTSQSK